VRDDESSFDEIDELFEPFELDDIPPPEIEPGPPVPTPPTASGGATARTATATVTCPSCGSPNPLTNLHCEQCGARLGDEPLPVAPPPNGGASPGMRALGFLAAVVLVVGLGALIFNTIRGGGTSETASTSTSTTSTLPPVATEIIPSSVEASSELEGFPATNLIDGDPTTYWNDNSLRGEGATLTFRFARPVSIREIEIQNVQNDEKFKRNFRIKGYIIKVDDIATEMSGRLEDTNEPRRISIASLQTTRLTIEVTSTYPAQAVGDKTAFNELALQEVRFFGVER